MIRCVRTATSTSPSPNGFASWVMLGLALSVAALSLWLKTPGPAELPTAALPVQADRSDTGEPQPPPNPVASGPREVDAAVSATETPPLPWQKVESDDYPTYIANLRALGAPEVTIRRVVAAELHQDYDRQRHDFLAKEPLPFWVAGYGSDETELPQFQAIAQREHAELEALLGPSDDEPEAWSADLNDGGLRLGGALAPKAARILELETRIADARDLIIDAAGNRPLTPPAGARLAQLRAEREAGLNALLSPEEREHYELRNSPAADALRDRLREFDVKVNETEFRQLYRLEAEYQRQLAASADGHGNAAAAERKYLEATSRILGPHRSFADPAE